MAKTNITTIQKEVSPVAKQIATLTITDSPSLSQAVDYLSRANKYLDSVIAYKEKKTAPINQALKVIRAETKPIETELSALISTLRDKISVYQTRITLEAKIQQDKIASRIGDGKGHIKLSTAITQLGQLETPETEVSTNNGTIKFRQTATLHISDSSLIPRDYLIPDEKRILEALKGGASIMGAEIVILQIPINYRS